MRLDTANCLGTARQQSFGAEQTISLYWIRQQSCKKGTGQLVTSRYRALIVRVSHYTPNRHAVLRGGGLYGTNIGNHIATRNEGRKHCNSIEMSVNRDIKRNENGVLK